MLGLKNLVEIIILNPFMTDLFLNIFFITVNLMFLAGYPKKSVGYLAVVKKSSKFNQAY